MDAVETSSPRQNGPCERPHRSAEPMPIAALLPRPVTKPCAKCGAPFTFVPFDMPGLQSSVFVPKHCEKCLAEIEAQEAENRKIAAEEQRKIDEARRKAAHEAGWIKLCPQKYRLLEEGGETDGHRLPAAKLEKILAWTPEQRPRGLVLHGETGLSKTRCLWRLLRRLYDERKKIIWFDCVSFGHECAKHFREGTEDQWIQNLMGADILFFDDLWKFAMTERSDAELFGVIERRSAHGKPYFLTTNFTGEALLAEARKPHARISHDRALAILRRLREDCRPISFI